MAGRSTPQAAGLGICHGGVMRTGRALIISAVLALGAAGPILASPAIAVTAAGVVPAVHVQLAASASAKTFYRA